MPVGGIIGTLTVVGPILWSQHGQIDEGVINRLRSIEDRLSLINKPSE